jgi:hypothetical protein
VQVEAASMLSVVVRSGPMKTAVNGTLVARPPRMAQVLTVDGDLRFSHAERDRLCPLRASDSRCHADPARTKDTSLEGTPASPITPNATPMAQAKLSSTGVADSVTPLA